MKIEGLVQIGGHKKIAPESILMLKADCNYTHIFLDDGKHILSSTTIGILEKRLKDFHFFRPNRSVVINLKYISDFENKAQTGDFPKILLKNNQTVSLSRRKTLQFLKIIQ